MEVVQDQTRVHVTVVILEQLVSLVIKFIWHPFKQTKIRYITNIF